MFCPECRCEFLEGIRKCSDCHVKLVRTLPELEQEEVAGEQPFTGEFDEKMCEVGMYRIPGAAEIARDFLAEKGIEAFVVGHPLGQVTRLYAKGRDENRALNLLLEEYGEAAEELSEQEKVQRQWERELAEGSNRTGFLGRVREYYTYISWIAFGIAVIVFGLVLMSIADESIRGFISFVGGVLVISIVVRRILRSRREKESR